MIDVPYNASSIVPGAIGYVDDSRVRTRRKYRPTGTN